jgi:Carboxypeptidase regulatory-like domain/TonB dependent receptor-like, beta-barrel
MLLLAAALFFSWPAAAQTRDSAAVSGKVLDSSGAAVSAAAVELESAARGIHRRAATSSRGDFIFPGLPVAGTYRLRVEKKGFQPFAQAGIELRAGATATFLIRLALAPLENSVTVSGAAGEVEARSPQTGMRLDPSAIETLPVEGPRLLDLALYDAAVGSARGTGDAFLNRTLFVIHGGGRRSTTYSLDGSTGDDTWGRQTLFTMLPLAAVQEFTVLTSAFSAEYGWTDGSAVNIVTRAGSNAVHGELVLLARPKSLEAAPPLATTHLGDRLAEASGAVSGPIVRNRTYFLVSAEYDRERRDSLITSPLAPGIFTGDARQTLLFFRLDQKLTPNHSLRARLDLDRMSDSNPADTVGGLDLPSTERIFRRRTYAAQAAETAILSPRAVNELRFQFQLGSPITQFQPVTPSTQFVYPGVAVTGESRSADLMNHQYEVADTWTWTAHRHTLQAGADVIASSSGGFGQEFGGGFVLGQFRVLPGITTPVSELTPSDLASYTQSFGNASYRARDNLWALFVQDEFQATPSLALTAGLRYSRQTFTGAIHDFAPRLGLAARLPLAKPTVLRASYGIFYDAVPANLAAGYSIFGPAGIFSFSAQPGQLGFPSTLAPLPSFPPGVPLPPRDITVRVGDAGFLSRFFDVSRLRSYPQTLLSPYTEQWTLGAETELEPGWVLSLDYTGSHSLRLLRPADLNAPAPFPRAAPGEVRSAAAADLTRPIVPVPDGYRRIVAMVNAGSAYYDGVEARLRKRFRNGYGLLLSYTWSHTIDTVDADVPSQDPNDSNFLGAAEKATSLLDQRHRAVLTGWCRLPWTITFGSSASLASGRPFNATTGADNNGDGSFADRPVIHGSVVSRNSGRGSPLYSLALFLEKEIALNEQVRLDLRADAFNLLNHDNIVGRNGVYGNLSSGQPLPTFGQPLPGIDQTEPGRQFQFELRLDF